MYPYTSLQPYRCARDDYSSGILLDANENSFGPAATSSFHFKELERYPDPHQHTVKSLLCKLRGLPDPSYFFTGVGSDESIDLIIRIFCTPASENILICPPTYGMYCVCAQVNDVGVVKVPLITSDASYQLDVPEVNQLFVTPLVSHLHLSLSTRSIKFSVKIKQSKWCFCVLLAILLGPY
jgi:histidinol-phosphate aminotransferase